MNGQQSCDVHKAAWPLVMKELEPTIIWKLPVFPEHWLRKVVCPKLEVDTTQDAYTWCLDQEKVGKRGDIWNNNFVYVLNYESGLGTLLKNVTSASIVFKKWVLYYGRVVRALLGVFKDQTVVKIRMKRFHPTTFSRQAYNTWEEGGWGKEKERNTVEHVVYIMCSSNEREKT